jgi:anaerobic magnesium-protoporphyrin IX monomethyl ester cyclase
MRILLINPPSPEQLGAPLLGLQYVAASLCAAGHDVRVIDAAAKFFSHDQEWIAGEAERWAPRLVGMGLFTRWVWHAYGLAALLRERGSWIMVAGGAHATVRPEETLHRGFDVALTGEAEESLPQLAAWIEGHAQLEQIPGAVFRRTGGGIGWGPPAQAVRDLDALAPAYLAQPLFEPRWYDSRGDTVTPGGILTSRGCPARCTFCANYVTGRRFRHRSAANVIAEIRTMHNNWGVSFFPCWDDALTADPRRLLDLCAALERGLGFPFAFSAITRANMVTLELLRAMRLAGLIHVNFGVESGDDEILRVIKKGIRTGQVVRALEWSKQEGLHTACNFMLGFPQETPAALERTLRFMERIAPLVDTFSTLGVVVPFPGTPIYDDYHEKFGFTGWWLREEYSRYTPPPPLDDAARFYRYYIDDANLDLDFFRYSRDVRDLIRAGLKFKAEHNLKAMGQPKVA